MPDRPSHYHAAWLAYLRAHRDPRTRYLHYIGSLGALAMLGLALVWGDPAWLLLALIFGYGLAWFAHAFIERNRPATFSEPLWSLFSDYRMLLLWLTGRLAPHLRAAGIPVGGDPASTSL